MDRTLDLGAYSTAEFNDDISLNVLEELNTKRGLEDEFNIRQKLYDTHELYHIPDANVSTEDNDDIKALKEQVKRGQELIKNEIINYTKLKDRIETLENKRHMYHDLVSTIKKSVFTMSTLDDTLFDDVKPLMDLISNTAEEVESKIKEKCNAESEQVHEMYRKSARVLLSLKDVYSILRNSDVNFTCPICITSQVDCFLFPCGHTLCSTCANELQQRCSICRQQFNKVGRLFFS
jgi:gas vesicle protein